MTVSARCLAVTLGVAALLGGPSAWADEVAISEEARERFAAGVRLLEDPDGPRYEDAYRAFQAAYRAAPSPKILGNLGLCAMMLERDGEAIEAYRRYLDEASDVDPAERGQIERDLRDLEASVVRLELSVSVPDASVVDVRVPVSGDEVVNRYAIAGDRFETGLRPGRHRLRIERVGHAPATVTFDAEARRPERHRVTLSPVGAEEGSAVPVPVVVGLAATGAFVVGASITGGLALSRQSDYRAINDGAAPEQAQAVRDEGLTLNVLTDVFAGAAVAAGVTTLVLYLTRSTPEPAPTEAARAARSPASRDTATVTPIFGPRLGGLLVWTPF